MLITKTMLAVVLFGGLLVQSGTGYKVVGRYPIGGTGGWDYINIDSSARRLYVSHSTQVEVVDADTGKIVGTIADTPGVHGVIAARSAWRRRLPVSLTMPRLTAYSSAAGTNRRWW